MLIKNKIIFVIICVLNLFYSNLYAEEFNISATEVLVDKANNIIIGRGNVEVVDAEENS